MTPQERLKRVIAYLTNDLEHYSRLPDAEEEHLINQNAHIAELVAVYNDFDSQVLHYYSVWKPVETEWLRLQHKDSEHAGICIEIWLKPTGVLCHLPINLCYNGI